MKTSTRISFVLILGSLLAVGYGCGTVGGPGTTLSGGNPALPPHPPAEVPSALRIPSGDELAVATGKISGDSAPAPLSVSLKADTVSSCDPSVDFTQSIAPVADVAKGVEDDLKSLMDPYNQLVIPVGTNVHTFEGLSVVQDVGTVVFVQMKIDFSDFDFDDNGLKEGCSGNTQQLPICMRIWANGKKEIAAVFTDYPAKDRPGAGRLMGLNITNSTFLFPENGFLSIIYDHSDPSTKVATELLTREADPAGFRIHFLADQEGEESTAIKTVGASFTGGGIGGSSSQAFMRFKEDANLISGNLQLIPNRSPTEPDLADQCIDLTTDRCVDASQCVDLGIDVDDTPFLGFPDETNVFIPADFPDAPTF